MKNKYFYILLGTFAIPVIWISVKYIFSIEDRYLPNPVDVLTSVNDIKPSILFHTAYSVFRLLIGLVFGIAIGIYFGLLLYKSRIYHYILNPIFQSLRSVPPFATIPFFLLWFGFSETGKFLIIVTGIAFNLAIATYQILEDSPERYKVFFRSIKSSTRKQTLKFALPYSLSKLLPTVRFSLSMAIGLAVVAEMLGSQVGLGYLIQTAKATFSLDVVFLVAIIWGVINYILDRTIQFIWSKLILWK